MSEKHEPCYTTPKIWNLAGLSEAELNEISFLIGGSTKKTIDTQEHPSFKRYDSIIMGWGDRRLQGVLERLEDQAGYRYGAEYTRLVALVGNQAVSMDIVPNIPPEPEIYTDNKGAVDGLLLGLADPEFNLANIFYSWDETGKQAVQDALGRDVPGQIWVKLNDYYLKFTVAAAYREQ